MLGWAINCTVELDLTGVGTGGVFSLWDQPGRYPDRPRAWHCAFVVTTASGGTFRLDASDTGIDVPPDPCVMGSCPCDVDGDGEAFITDLLTFLSQWFGGTPGADFDGDGTVTIQDLLEYLVCWFGAQESLPVWIGAEMGELGAVAHGYRFWRRRSSARGGRGCSMATRITGSIRRHTTGTRTRWSCRRRT